MFGHISGRSVYFHYPCRPDVKVLRGLNISVSPGETLALVGSSGSGKSTIVSLIERFYQPSVGVITLDRQNIAGLDLKWLRSQIGYVPQEPVLFNTTIADNIRYGALFREVSDEEMVEVAKACNIHDFIQSLPQVRYLYVVCFDPFKRIYFFSGIQHSGRSWWQSFEWRSEAEDRYCKGSCKES